MLLLLITTIFIGRKQTEHVKNVVAAARIFAAVRIVAAARMMDVTAFVWFQHLLLLFPTSAF